MNIFLSCPCKFRAILNSKKEFELFEFFSTNYKFSFNCKIFFIDVHMNFSNFLLTLSKTKSYFIGILSHISKKKYCPFSSSLSQAYAIESSQWGPLYTVKGILHIPYGNSEVRDEFQAWVDEKQERSRIDYNSGTVKTYQFRHNSTFGELIKIYPTQDWKDGETKYECLKNLTQSVVFQPAIPNLVEFKTNGMRCVCLKKMLLHISILFLNKHAH